MMKYESGVLPQLSDKRLLCNVSLLGGLTTNAPPHLVIIEWERVQWLDQVTPPLSLFSLRTFYLPGAFVMSDEMVELAGTLRCLDAIDFK